MQTSPSHSSLRDPQRIARHAILNGIPIPPRTAAQLEALGIDVGALERRIIMSMEFVR
jgi:hypothetical protein